MLCALLEKFSANVIKMATRIFFVQFPLCASHFPRYNSSWIFFGFPSSSSCYCIGLKSSFLMRNIHDRFAGKTVESNIKCSQFGIELSPRRTDSIQKSTAQCSSIELSLLSATSIWNWFDLDHTHSLTKKKTWKEKRKGTHRIGYFYIYMDFVDIFWSIIYDSVESTANTPA